MRDGSRGLVAVIVESCEQHSHLRVAPQPRRGLQGSERLVGTPGVDGGDAGSFEERRVFWHRGEPLSEEQRRFLRPSLRQRTPAPRLEAAADILTARETVGPLTCGLTESVAGTSQLTGGVEPNRILGQCCCIIGAWDRDDGVGRRRSVDGPPERCAEQPDAGDEGRECSIHGGRAQRGGSSRKSGCPYSTGWPFSTRTFTMRPAALDSISFISFIASMMQRIWPSFTTSPSRTKGSAVGAEAR